MLPVSHEKTLLRLLTCGSVDDGKSTLIGRLLHDCGILYDDQLAMLEKERTSEGLPDFSRLLDGLLAEREQAITIDAAYRSFSSASRRYLIADAPGHEQYTRNMVTAATHADAALILVDATRIKGELLPQTKRHTAIVAMLGLRDVIFAVNKMDRCAYSQDIFRAIEAECLKLARPLGFGSAACLPVSALHGDNVYHKSRAMPWYDGATLFDLLEGLKAGLEAGTAPDGAFRMPVQWVTRGKDFRGLAGAIVSGSVKPGETVLAQPSGRRGVVRRLAAFDGDMPEAHAEDAVCIQLVEDLDISRGEVLVSPDAPLEVADQFAARVVWLGEEAMQPGRGYIFRQGTAETTASVTELVHVLDLETMTEAPAKSIPGGGTGRIKLALARALPFCPYAENKDLGAFLLADRISGNTVGAGLIEYALRRSHTLFPYDFTLNKAAQARQKEQTPRVLWCTGLSASGKSSLADAVAGRLHALGRHVYILDGDTLRLGLNKDLGFTEPDRVENIRRAAETAKILVDAGLIVLATFISPYRADRLAIRELFAPGEFSEIFIDTPLELCVARDPKGLYKKALAGELPNFTGISAPFEAPETPDLRLDGTRPLDDLAQELVMYWQKLG